MMRFFEVQQEARRQTGWLVLLYIVALLLAVAALTWVCGWLFPANTDNTAKYVYTALMWAVVMLGASVYRLRSLSGGGEVVAEALGGVRLQTDSTDRQERRLLNVVEEMALAAMLPVPKIYVLPDGSINAFAAGSVPENAVIGITRGALRHLNRLELQAVVAHEFSHIANGDMRLNMRLTGWLFGLQLVSWCGRQMIFGRLDDRNKPFPDYPAQEVAAGCLGMLPVIAVAAVLMLVGGFGSLLAGWIQAAICRKREYLADASAVQFTRQTEGMVGALHKIAVVPVRRLQSWHAAEYAHFMLGSVREPDIFDKLAATHPATIERIRRLNPFRARELAVEITEAESLRLSGYEGWLAFGSAGRENAWAEAEADARMRDAGQRAEAMSRRIEIFQPDWAVRSAEWRRQAPQAWLAAVDDSDRMPLLLGAMLAGPGDISESVQQKWAMQQPLFADTLARLLQYTPPAAYYADILESLLPPAAADEVLPALLADAQQIFTANAAPSLMQGCVWLLLRVYADGRDTADIRGDEAAQITAFAAFALPASFQTAAVNIPQPAWQALCRALDAAATLPETVRRDILADCRRHTDAASDRMRAERLFYMLRVALDITH